MFLAFQLSFLKEDYIASPFICVWLQKPLFIIKNYPSVEGEYAIKNKATRNSNKLKYYKKKEERKSNATTETHVDSNLINCSLRNKLTPTFQESV